RAVAGSGTWTESCARIASSWTSHWIRIGTACKHPRGADIGFVDERQLLCLYGRRGVFEQAVRLTQACAVQGVADRARVGAMRLRQAAADVLGHRRAPRSIEAVG